VPVLMAVYARRGAARSMTGSLGIRSSGLDEDERERDDDRLGLPRTGGFSRPSSRGAPGARSRIAGPIDTTGMVDLVTSPTPGEGSGADG